MTNKYAKINSDNVVENIIISDSAFIQQLDGRYIEVTNETGIAAPGSTYSEEKNKFALKTFPSWVFDEDAYEWKAPVEKPSTGNYIWSESNLEWEEIIPDTPSEE